jgi:hypothetical protein
MGRPARQDPIEPAAPADEGTGLPLGLGWRAVYGVVIALFVVWIALLTVLTFAYP